MGEALQPAQGLPGEGDGISAWLSVHVDVVEEFNHAALLSSVSRIDEDRC
ncbi:hypothetical protein ACFXPY_00555 [Streptomyces sp. NPDC059153]